MRISQRKELQREFEIYQRLPPHPRLVRMYGFSDDVIDGDRGLVLEYMPRGDLRRFLAFDADITVDQRLRWCAQAAEAVALLHSHGVLHCDLRPDNMVLDSDLNLRLIDLCGSIDGKEPMALESARFFLPRDTRKLAGCSTTTELFALGSSFYEIITGKPPYAEIKSDDEIEARFARKEFPPVDSLPLAGIIQSCWMGDFGSAGEALAAIEAEIEKRQAE